MYITKNHQWKLFMVEVVHDLAVTHDSLRYQLGELSCLPEPYRIKVTIVHLKHQSRNYSLAHFYAISYVR